jgi:hypothetical protein
MKRSLGAELAVGSTETSSSAIVRLETKILTTTDDGFRYNNTNILIILRCPFENETSSSMRGNRRSKTIFSTLHSQAFSATKASEGSQA